MIKENIEKNINDKDIYRDIFYIWDIKFILSHIMNNYIQFILLLFVFFIIYITDYINYINNMTGLQVSSSIINSQNNIITKNINKKIK